MRKVLPGFPPSFCALEGMPRCKQWEIRLVMPFICSGFHTKRRTEARANLDSQLHGSTVSNPARWLMSPRRQQSDRSFIWLPPEEAGISLASSHPLNARLPLLQPQPNLQEHVLWVPAMLPELIKPPCNLRHKDEILHWIALFQFFWTVESWFCRPNKSREFTTFYHLRGPRADRHWGKYWVVERESDWFVRSARI